ncbi:hypothetical protein [Streptomyces sp. NBC_00199]|uniref:hypothetical protein n=1 Tax=Streptomyces sp. NBC_00199 TaxID=2975678 RepID=UPI00225448AA|nr:hypothetical protein [Streptomyces sp. NBC_00199]MCX5263476.1 hypothetical protein [Streptomyces sp. NBC_00199]
MRRVRPGVAAARGSTGGAGSAAPRTPGEERALTSVAAGERYRAQEVAESKGGQPVEVARLWHVTLSVSGEEAPVQEIRRALEQLAHDHPFLLTSRYAGDHAEIRYWEEARDLHDAAAVALRLWGEHRQTAGLPPWEIVGLEVIDRQTYHQRIAEGYGPAPATPVGVHPY